MKREVGHEEEWCEGDGEAAGLQDDGADDGMGDGADDGEREYVGVVRSADGESGAEAFTVNLRWQGTRYMLGSFSTAREAAKAYDWAARMIEGGKALNFSREADLGEPPATPHAEKLLARVAQKCGDREAAAQGISQQAGSSRKYLGVLPNKNSPAAPFKAVLHWPSEEGAQYHIGSYATALAAAKAYDWAARLVGDTPLNFVPYSELGHPPRGPVVDQMRARLAELRGPLPLASVRVS